jgi:hypothetical protein
MVFAEEINVGEVEQSDEPASSLSNPSLDGRAVLRNLAITAHGTPCTSEMLCKKVRMTCASGQMKQPSQTPLVLNVSVVYEAGLFTEGRERLYAGPPRGVF